MAVSHAWARPNLPIDQPAAIHNLREIDLELINPAERGDIDTVRMLLKKGADANTRNANGRPVLNGAAKHCYAKVASLLLDHGADVNAQDLETGNTAVMESIEANDARCVQLFLRDYYTRLDITNYAGFTGHALAYLSKSAPVRTAYDNYMAQVDQKLVYAVTHQDCELVATSLRKGANADITLNNGDTVLMYAAKYGNEFAVGQLLIFKANPYIEKDGKIALTMALESGKLKTAKAIYRAQRDVTEDMRRAFHDAAEYAAQFGATHTLDWVRRTFPKSVAYN